MTTMPDEVVQAVTANYKALGMKPEQIKQALTVIECADIRSVMMMAIAIDHKLNVHAAILREIAARLVSK